MKDLRIFVSYSHDDEAIATALSNLLQQALGPAVEEVFLDKSSISFGSGIKESIVEALDHADTLIAVITGGEPASALSWPAYEISRFTTGWDPRFREAGLHQNRDHGPVIGKVVVLGNGKLQLGPESGKRPVELGITESDLSDAGDESFDTNTFLRNAVANSDLLEFIREMEALVKNEQDYAQFFRDRRRSLADLVSDFKADAFLELKRRIRSISKPSKQLIVRYRELPSSPVLNLQADARVFSVGGASDVFGKREDDPLLFKKVPRATPGDDRYETDWGRFRASVQDHPHGPYWCGVIEQAVIDARHEGAELDPNLVLTSSKNQRYRVIATTVTTYFNNEAEVSLYLIEGLQRRNWGDPETSTLLSCLIIICRFRFAFLEGTSPFYWRNFESASSAVEARAKDLLMELDYLRSEAIHANLEKPGAYEGLVTSEQLTQMMQIWQEVDPQLRNACTDIIGGRADLANEGAKQTVTQLLKRIFEEVKPFNNLLGAAVTKRLFEIFGGEIGGDYKPEALPA